MLSSLVLTFKVRSSALLYPATSFFKSTSGIASMTSNDAWNNLKCLYAIKLRTRVSNKKKSSPWFDVAHAPCPILFMPSNTLWKNLLILIVPCQMMILLFMFFWVSVLSSKRSLCWFILRIPQSHLKNYIIYWLDIKPISNALTLLLTLWLKLQIMPTRRSTTILALNHSSTYNNSSPFKSSDLFHPIA